MLKMYRIPIKSVPLQYLKTRLMEINDSRTIVLVPTNRNLRSLVSAHRWELDIQTVSEFTRRSNKYDGVVLPKELRSYFLFTAAKNLADSDLHMLLRERSPEIKNYLSFVKKTPSIMQFFRELAAEGIDTSKLMDKYRYEDYADQVETLITLWGLHCKTVKDAGFIDEWEQYLSPQLDLQYLKRYDRYIFLIGGYLTHYEIVQLQRLAEDHQVELYFNYNSSSHHQQERLKDVFGVDIEQPEDDPLMEYTAVESPSAVDMLVKTDKIGVLNHNWGAPLGKRRSSSGINSKLVEVVGCDSKMSQYDLITKRILELHFTGNVPFHRMAVVLPGGGMLPWFINADTYSLYNVSAGQELAGVSFYQQLEVLSTLLSGMEWVEGKYRIPLVALEIFAYDRSKKDRRRLLDGYRTEGMLHLDQHIFEHSPEWVDIYQQISCFLTPYSTYTDVIKGVSAMLKSQQGATPPVNTLYEWDSVVERVHDELEKLSTLFRLVPDRMPTVDILNAVLSELSKVSIPIVKGQVAVIGLLESRNLQYDYLFLPDLNSDVFPVAQGKDLFLNSELRHRLGLPTFADREDLQKGYFYQIIERAKRVVMTYAKSADTRISSFVGELLSKAGSRVIDDNDLEIYSPNNYMVLPFAYPSKVVSGEVLMTDDMANFLQGYALSATSLKCMRDCQLQFFYKYIKRLYPETDPVDKADMRELGIVLHELLAVLFKKGVRADSRDYLKCMEEEFDRQISAYDFFKHNAVGVFQAEALKKYFPDIVAQERRRLDEGYIIQGVEVPTGDVEMFGFKFKGVIDRWDKSAAGYSIIDYKYKNIKSLSKYDFSKVDIQLPLYALIMEKKMNRLPEELLWFDLKKSQRFIEGFSIDNIEMFRTDLFEMLENVKSSEILTGAVDVNVCKYCQYSSFCHKTLL